MAKVEDVQVAQVTIVWDGRRIQLRSNCTPPTEVLLTAAAARLALDRFLKGPGSAADLVKAMRGES